MTQINITADQLNQAVDHPISLADFPQLQGKFKKLMDSLALAIRENKDLVAAEIKIAIRFHKEDGRFTSGINMEYKSAKASAPCDEVVVIREDGELIVPRKTQADLFEEGK